MMEGDNDDRVMKSDLNLWYGTIVGRQVAPLAIGVVTSRNTSSIRTVRMPDFD
jgi:hypothetical protein